MSDLLRSLWCRIRGHKWGPWVREPSMFSAGHFFTARCCERCELVDFGSSFRTATTEAKP